MILAALIAYALGGILAGASMGGEWLAEANRAGFSRAVMLAAPLVLIGASIGFAHCGKTGAAGRFYALLALSSAVGAAYWSRVGWLGRWPDAGILGFVDAILSIAALASAGAAVTSAWRVGEASRGEVRWLLRAVVGSALAVGAACSWDALCRVEDLPQPALVAIGLCAIVAPSVGAFATSLRLPRRSP